MIPDRRRISRSAVAILLIATAAGDAWAQARLEQPILPPVRPPDLRSAPPFDDLPPLARVRPAPVAPPAGELAAIAAAKLCLDRLMANQGKRVKALDAATLEPRADPACRVEAPVALEAISTPDGAELALTPPPTLSCEMAMAVVGWAGTSLQPLALGAFGRPLARLSVGGGHECRRRNRASAGPVSEHGTGRALDIFAFTLAGDASGATISVERPEGDAQKRFLDSVRQSACGAFMTALGPGADAAHANHIHVDIQARRSAASRFCQ